jgi:hypothetical protein
MKKIYKNFLSVIACVLCFYAPAQVSSYFFAQSNGSYTPITGGTVIATPVANTTTGNLSNTVWNLPNGTIPFNFVYNGIAYTGFNISCNGYITFGATPPATNAGSPISSATAYDGAVAAWGRATNGVFNLPGSGSTATFSYTSELRVEVLGTSPNQTVVIQFDNWRYSSGTTAVTWLHDFQIRLIETTNVVEIIYGDGIMAGGSLSTSGFNIQVGLRGLTNTDYNNRSSFGLFNQSTAGTANNANQVIGVTSGVGVFMPPTGLTYRWYPPCSTGTAVTPSVTASSTLLCEGDTLNFGATGETPFYNISYQWQQSTTPGGPYTNVTGPSSGTTFATYQTAATPGIFYYVLVTTCSTVPYSATSNEIVVDVRPLPIINIVSNPALNTTVTPIETCFGETYTLTATGADTYSWLGGPTTDSYVVQPAGNPSYLVVGTSTDGCVASRTLNIQVNPLPVISMLASPDSICPGKPVVIGASGNAVTYTWTSPNSNAFLITVSPTITTTYSVMGTAANSCTNIASKQIIVHIVTPVVATSSVTGSICKGEKVTLSATGSNSYTWVAPGSYTTGQVVSLTPAVTTNYTVTGTDLKGCVSQATLTQAVSGCVALNENAGNLKDLMIYPNPTNGIFTVELNNGALKNIEVMDVTGRVVLSSSATSDKVELSITGLAVGIYYLRIQSDNAMQVVRIVKE